jgi:thiol-disulfide isomerase/thioredoxin
LPVGQDAISNESLSFRLSGGLIVTDARHDADEVVVGLGPATVVHDQSLSLHDVRLDMTWQATGSIGVWAAAGMRWIDTSIVYRDSGGAPVTIFRPSIHHRNETITGATDAELGASWRSKWSVVNFQARFGATLPFGHTVEDPFVLGDQGQQHEHIQTGTGTVDPIVSVSAGGSWRHWDVAASAWTRQILYSNSHGYRGGSRYAAGMSVGRTLLPSLNMRAMLDVTRESAERWNGIVHNDDGNLGRTDALVGAATTWRVAPQLALEASVKIPVYVDVVGGQIEYPAIFGVALQFSPLAHQPNVPKAHHHEGENGDDDHDAHEHGDDQDHADPDPAFVIRLDGNAADFQLSTKEITVVDFGASWCAPCKKLTPKLIALVANYQGIAVRLADVSDPSSRLSHARFGNEQYTLPLVEVFDLTGKPIASLRGGPDAILQALEQLLQQRKNLH